MLFQTCMIRFENHVCPDVVMSETQITDWDDAYANAAHIAGAETFPPRWAADAEAFRTTWQNKELDVPYGDKARNRFDLFSPSGQSAGLVVFVHGGYWLKFDKSAWSHFAAGALSNGWTVCLPSYEHASDVPISEITQQVGAAITAAAQRVSGPIRLTGHSAGGHLVSRMVCEDTPLAGPVAARVDRVVSISGLHDLNPLRNTQMNESFQLTEESAAAESPALKKRLGGFEVVAWVGEAERPEFIRQSRLLAEAWPNTRFEAAPGKHHFDVIDDLQDPRSGLGQALLG